MSERPFEKLLHRELHMHDVQQNFEQQLLLVRDVVNYGTNLIPATFLTSSRELVDVIILPVLLKQMVSMLDAFEVLVSNACVPASLLQSRAAFEASIYIDFMLAGNGDEKAKHFYVSNIRKEMEWAKRTQTGDPAQVLFFKALGEFGNALDLTKNNLAAAAKTQLDIANAFLSNEPWRSVNVNIEAARGNRAHDLPWYAPFGPKSVRQLSGVVGRLHEYEVFYGASSEKMHASDYKSHVTLGGGTMSMEPIRNLLCLASSLRFTLSVAFHTYKRVLQAYRPGQIEEYNRRYMTDWRDPFMSMPDVKYESTNVEL